MLMLVWSADFSQDPAGRADIDKRHDDGHAGLRKAASIGELVISQAASARVKQYVRELGMRSMGGGPTASKEELVQFVKQVNELTIQARDDVLAEARRDLAVDRDWYYFWKAFRRSK